MRRSYFNYLALGLGLLVTSVVALQSAWATTPRRFCGQQVDGDYEECLARGGDTRLCEVVACAKLMQCRKELGLPPVVPGTFDDEVAYCLKEIFDEPYCEASTTVEN